MCLCNGTGGIQQVYGAVIEFIPCPDTNCQFDREAADKEYEEWKNKVEEYYKNNDFSGEVS